MINASRKRSTDKLLYTRQLFFAPGSHCAYFIAVFHALSDVLHKLEKKTRDQYLSRFVQLLKRDVGAAARGESQNHEKLSIKPASLTFFSRYNAIRNTNGHRLPSADRELMRSYSHSLARADMQRFACRSGASQSEPDLGFSTASGNITPCSRNRYRLSFAHDVGE